MPSSEARISVLAGEAEHRAKNMLATVQAIVRLSQAETVTQFKDAIEGRLQALANIHNLFVESRWSGAKLHDLTTKELAPYRKGDGTRVAIEGPDLVLKPNEAQTVAVIFHELATNAAKYGALSVSKGRIVISWTRAENEPLVLRWTESGGPPVTPPKREGFGNRLMAILVDQAKGEMRLDWRPAGLACEISLPISGQ